MKPSDSAGPQNVGSDLVNRQTAYHLRRVSHSEDIDRDVHTAMRMHLQQDLGLSDRVAKARAAQEIERSAPAAVIDLLSRRGISIRGRDILDLGAGFGGMSEELVLQGAHVVALEPGASSAALARRRVARHDGKFHLFEAFGESMPLAAETADLVISLQVLEHVADPQKVLTEVWRVLRPGGFFYLACENYLSFQEPHYRVPWFPLMPKRLGGVYLKAIGRSPKFLYEAVNYTTYPGVLKYCRQLGFVRCRDQDIVKALKSRPGLKWQLLRALSRISGERVTLAMDIAARAFTPGIHELFQKPHRTAPDTYDRPCGG
jgi:SAM-dependent methyltransferase